MHGQIQLLALGIHSGAQLFNIESFLINNPGFLQAGRSSSQRSLPYHQDAAQREQIAEIEVIERNDRRKSQPAGFSRFSPSRSKIQPTANRASQRRPQQPTRWARALRVLRPAL